MGESGTAVALRNVRKAYIEGVPVLAGVDLDIPHGAVTALIGANGSGKSTLVKILSGYHQADPGSQIRIGGRAIGHLTPETARAAGVRFVHQDNTLVPGLSVLDNMLVGAYPTTRLGTIRWAREHRTVTGLLERWGIDARTTDDVGALPRATSAKLSVLRALRTRPGESLRAVILDEPTAALGKDDAAEVLEWIRGLAADNDVGVLFIGHRLDEILGVADSVAVLRGGRVVAHEPSRSLTHEQLVEHIVGTAPGRFYPDRVTPSASAVGLSVRSLGGAALGGVSFDVAEGEVVGVTGLPGSGFEDLARLLFDPDLATSGTIEIAGQRIDAATTPIAERVRLGLVLVPDDRKRLALATELSLSENVSLPRIRTFIRGGLLRRTEESRHTGILIEDYRVVPAVPQIAANRLSGGNQQKVVMAKWLSTKPRVLVVHEPTQAVDVGAKSEIFRLLAASSARGMATVIVSVEYEDLAHLCDRVLVIGGGGIVAEFGGDELTTDAVTAAAFLSSTRTGLNGKTVDA
ncbi:sugar ABC transporter ATP-binding protein [Pseudonocardia hispaniensis]|uniref:Sugar ABC transporter ATP-binding protein n=1 Tax=Pseudonocardia hispaniensis TaxID=904933 RepID=A0ABW1IZ00_9PSEU